MAGGRPKGAKTKSTFVDVQNVIPPKPNKVDENGNSHHPPPTPPSKSKPTISTRNKSHTNKVCASLLGAPIPHFNTTKLPQNKAVLRRYTALREEMPKEKMYNLIIIP